MSVSEQLHIYPSPVTQQQSTEKKVKVNVGLGEG